MDISGTTYNYRSSQIEDEHKHLVRIDELEETMSGYRADMIKAVTSSDAAAYKKIKQKMTAARDEIEMHEKYIDYLVTGRVYIP